MVVGGATVEATQRVRSLRNRLVSEGSVIGADGTSLELFPTSIGPEEGASLVDVVREERASRTLEVGLGFAVSTLFICEGLLENGEGGRHLAMDPYQLRPGHV
jgi:predicted O-methyltransferase YrrM